MRIVGGRHRGRRLEAPPGDAVRPTADRARQALFDRLAHADLGGDGTSPLIGARVLDAFAGSGALGLEALSRGAAHATFLEDAPAAIAAIRANIAVLGEGRRTTLRRADATRPPPAPADPGTMPCDLVFLDPPYGSGLALPALAALAAAGWVADRALAIVETGAGETPGEPPAGFAVGDSRRHGRRPC
ncbi:MAG: 16S rRNA (guanine(966)-N(2))-methyltransferase RsmD [Dongiaceae bacterium]